MVGSPRGPTSPTKLLLGLVVASLSAGASAQDRSVALSYDAAAHRLANVSPALSAADHAETAARETAAAVATLHRPILTASAQYLQYQKTLSVDLTGSKQSASDATQISCRASPAPCRRPFSRSRTISSAASRRRCPACSRSFPTACPIVIATMCSARRCRASCRSIRAARSPRPSAVPRPGRRWRRRARRRHAT